MNLEDIKFKCNGNDLDSQQLEEISRILLNLNLAQSKRQGRFLFRGENFDNLCKKLDHNEFSGIDSFNAKLFMVGDKGKQSYGDGKGYKIYLEDTTENIYQYIFDRLNKILKEKNNQVKGFSLHNTDFVNYFKDKKKNRANFCNTIVSIQNEDTRRKIRNYYLTLLHHREYVGFKDNSFFLSTTTSFTVAEKFSPNMQLVCWLPEVNRSITKRLQLDQLPIYKGSFYPNQKEVSLVGGILPHYILGYIKEGVFEVSPHIFEEQSLERLIKYGLRIDQTNFLEVLATTNYTSGFVDDGERINTIRMG